MNLKQIQEKYDLVVGLGCNCQVAYQLKRLNLRKFAAPMDTLLVNDIRQVNAFVGNDYKDFMKLKNLKLDEDLVNPDSKNYLVYDTVYDCYSYHDYPKRFPKKIWFASHLSYRRRLNRRIKKFISSIANADSILFVRTSEAYEYEGLVELKNILKYKTKNNFKILGIKYGEKYKEYQCEDDSICIVEIKHNPQKDFWQGEDNIWDQLLGEVKVNDT